jgi:hypothetical protein
MHRGAVDVVFFNRVTDRELGWGSIGGKMG